MPKYHPIFRSFAGGEVSPRLTIRQDLDNPQQGAAEMTNMLPLRHGPTARRVGMEYIDTYPGTSTAKLFTFHVSPAESFVVSVMDDGNVRVADETGLVLSSNIVSNPAFDEGLDQWISTSDNKADVLWENGVAIFGTTLAGAEARLGQQLNTAGETNTDHEVRIIAVPGAAASDLQIRVGTAFGLADIASGVFTTNTKAYTFNPGGLSTVWITFVMEGNDPPGNVWTLDSVRCSAVTAAPLVFAHPWDVDDISDLQALMPPGEDVIFFTTPRVAQQELSYNKTTQVWAFGAIVFNVPPAEWTGANFPAALTFFQGRSWWGGTPGEPSKIWASKSGQLRNMDPGTEGLTDDALDLQLSRRGKIEWMEGIKNLLIGTENGEFIVDAEQGIIEPGDIQVTQQSAYGATNAQSIPLGNEVLFLSADGTKLRRMGYSWTEDGWLTRDLMWPAEHMGIGSPMREIDYVKEPESTIYCLSLGGEIYSCTLDPNSNFVGWCRLNTDGRILSLTVTQSRGSSIVWVLVDRRYDPDGDIYLERMEELSEAIDYLDSHTIQTHDEPTDQIAAIPHLADQLVDVTVDNAVHPPVLLNNLGEGVLTFKGVRFAVGFSFNSKLVTLPLDQGTGSGSGHSMTKRWNRIVVRVLDSALPIINGERQPDRSPATLMDTPEPNRTQDVETRQIGFDDTAQITIEQDLPARDLMVVGIFGEFGQDSL